MYELYVHFSVSFNKEENVIMLLTHAPLLN